LGWILRVCIVIDPGTFPSIFNTSISDHTDFKPVLRWIVDGPGKIIYGGSKYKRELSRIPRYLGFLVELRRAGKVIELQQSLVDQLEQQLLDTMSHPDFDDEHIVSIVVISRSRLVCTRDRRACRFIKESRLYPGDCSRPKIYSRSTHSRLLINGCSGC